jgi:hypothetical protein
MNISRESGPESITRNDVWAEAPEVNGTELIVQRHEEYVRDPSSPQRGSLTTESAERGRLQTERVFKGILEQIPESERGLIDVMVVGSPTQYMDGGRRSMETAVQVLAGLRTVFNEYNLSPSQLLNNQSRLKLEGKPIQSKSIVEPKIFSENPDFVEFLKQEQYGNGAINQGFFKAYEEDEGVVRETRLAMGAEGPEDMANRLGNYLYALKRYSEKYHRNNSGKRLIIWTVSHYDTISPFVRTRIGGGKEGYLGVDYGAGIAINLKPDGSSVTKIGGKDYAIPLVRTSTASSID